MPRTRKTTTGGNTGDARSGSASPQGARSEKKRLLTRRRFLKVCGALALVGVGAPVHARYVEPNLIDVTRHEAFLPDLPPALDGLVVAQLSDLHRGPRTPDATIRHAVAAAVAVAPDLIVLTGDFVNRSTDDAPALAKQLLPLHAAARLGVFGCLGNHDYADWKGDAVAEALTAGGTVMLRNDGRSIAPGLYLAGVEDKVRGHPDMAQALRGQPSGAACVVLAHNPRAVFDCDTRPVLVLSGHTHGGQVRLPGLAPRVPPDMRGFPLADGWGLFDQARLYVSRGVGMTGLPLRFRCRPEVAVITLRRGDGPPITRPDLAERAFRKAKNVAQAVYRRVT